MKPLEISKIIEQEIGGNWSIPNPHHIDLRKCLVVPPVKQVYDDSFNEGKTINLWLILEETPGDKSGYKIVFDEKTRMFGLATSGFHDHDGFIGFYGTFLETLMSM